MTILSLSSSARKLLNDNQENSAESLPIKAWSGKPRPLPRISIRKRPHPPRDEDTIPCVTSAFLSNLFADAAGTDDRCQKKPCLTKTKSHKSFGVPLDTAGSCSPMTAFTSFFRNENQENTKSPAIGADTTSAIDTFTFPILPAAVSDSSYASQSLISVVPDQPLSSTDAITMKESYGWFVETDFQVKSSLEHEDSAYGALTPSPAHDLAFAPPAAPKATDLDAEVEWAKAADTVDDVLGDFF